MPRFKSPDWTYSRNTRIFGRIDNFVSIYLERHVLCSRKRANSSFACDEKRNNRRRVIEFLGGPTSGELKPAKELLFRLSFALFIILKNSFSMVRSGGSLFK